MKKKIAILCSFVMLTSMLTACESDSPAEMWGVFLKCKEETGNAIDAIGRYATYYGWNYFMYKDSAKDVRWEDAAKKSEILSHLPKLSDTIDTIEYGNTSCTLHYKDPDHETTMDDFYVKLKEAGFSFVQKNIDKDEYYLRYQISMDADKILSVRITAYKHKYSETHNVEVWMHYESK